MPRVKNPTIDSNDKLILRLMENVFEKQIFEPHQAYTIKDRASLLSKVAAENDVKLAESELRNKFLTPFYKRQPITISREYGINLSILLSRLQGSLELSLHIDDIDQLRQLYELVSDPVITSRAKDLFDKLYGNRSSLLALVGSSWWVAERIGDHPIKGNKWGIAIGRISFTLDNGYVLTEAKFKFENTVRNYFGLASHDAKSDYLFIDQISLDETKRRSNIMLRLADVDYNDQSLIIGHWCYHAKKYARLVSKTVIFWKISGDLQNELHVGNYLSDEDQYSLIPEEIRGFLYSREKNRMSVPLKIVTNLQDLSELLRKRSGSLLYKAVRENLKGEYLVYYKRETELIENQLIIDYDSDSPVIGCRFIHSADVRFNIKTDWKGTVDYNSIQNAIVLVMEVENSAKELTEHDPILLSFSLPPEDLKFERVECFQGIISGLGDNRAGAVSYKCVVIPADLANFNGLEDERIKNIFDGDIQQLSLRPNSGFVLKDFKF